MALDPPRKPTRIPVCRVLSNGASLDLFTLTTNTIRALDVHMLNLEFGYVTIKVAHGRVAGFDRMETHKVIDDLVGQPPPREAVA